MYGMGIVVHVQSRHDGAVGGAVGIKYRFHLWGLVGDQ